MTIRLWYNCICLDGNDGGALFCATDHNLMTCGPSAPHKTFSSVLLHLGNGGKSYGGRFVMFTDVEWAYWAGFIDGDGCICITGNKQRPPHLVIVLTQAEPTLLKWGLEKTQLGHIYEVPQTRSEWVNGVTYDWRILSKEAEIILGGILPYLKIKRARAEIALAFCEYRDSCGIKMGTRTPQHVLDNLWGYAYSMREAKISRDAVSFVRPESLAQKLQMELPCLENL